MRILVDTSVWVNHFKTGNDALMQWLAQDRVITHPMVIGEIACGTPPGRTSILRDFLRLDQAYPARFHELLDFVDKNRIYGSGCGWVDVNLVFSTLITPNVTLWTLDKRLQQLAIQFEIAHTPSAH